MIDDHIYIAEWGNPEATYELACFSQNSNGKTGMVGEGGGQVSHNDYTARPGVDLR